MKFSHTTTTCVYVCMCVSLLDSYGNERAVKNHLRDRHAAVRETHASLNVYILTLTYIHTYVLIYTEYSHTW